jgi:hypothetical protein
MSEPRELAEARRCLAQAETQFRSAASLVQLRAGLALLDDVLVAGTAAEARTARNLASSYAARIYARINTLVAHDRQLPEPLLEHFFKLVLAFDQVPVELPKAAAALKVEVVRQLIDRYYEGHPPERKEQALKELAQLTGRD